MQKTTNSVSKHFILHALAHGIFAAIAQDGGSAICNSGLINLGEQIVVFDTFLTPQAAMDLRQSALEQFGRTPQIVINSHYHNDHIWGNQVFVNEVQIISSARTRDLITTAGMEEFREYSTNAAHQLESIPYALQWGRGIDFKLGEKFVKMYVSELTIDMGQRGKRALELLFSLGFRKGLIPSTPDIRLV